MAWLVSLNKVEVTAVGPNRLERMAGDVFLRTGVEPEWIVHD